MDTVSVIDAFDFGYDPVHKEHNVSLLSEKGFRLYRGDIRDRALLQQMFSDNTPDVVVHLAASRCPTVFIGTRLLHRHQYRWNVKNHGLHA